MSGRLRTYARINARSQKVKDGAEAFKAVYAEVDARSEGRCEWDDEREASGALGPILVRCVKRATDKHHTIKPRRSPLNHRPENIIALCRSHHERCEWPYSRGRGQATALGDGSFKCETVYAGSKFHARGQGQ